MKMVVRKRKWGWYDLHILIFCRADGKSGRECRPRIKPEGDGSDTVETCVKLEQNVRMVSKIIKHELIRRAPSSQLLFPSAIT